MAHTGAFVQQEGPGAGGRTPAAMVEAKRTLVKSGPELWAELSDPDALARHLEPFGEVRPVDARDESLVAWEGERARGRVVLEPAGFGTRVTLQATIARTQPPAPPEPPRRGFWARLRRRGPDAPASAPPAAPPAMSDEAALGALTAVLDRLGRAHHRPFSRA